MPQYQTPGVYVEEVERGPKPIEGVSTSVAGFLGETERGPTSPQLVTSFSDFKRKFGGYTDSNLAYAVDGFFRNGGGRCYVARVVPKYWITDAADDSTGSATLTDSGDENAITVTATGPGDWGNDVAVWIDDATVGTDTFRATVGYWDDLSSVTKEDGTLDEGELTSLEQGSLYDELVETVGDPKVEEVYDNLTTEKSSSNYYESRVNGVSNLVTLSREGDGVPSKDGITILSAEPPTEADLDDDPATEKQDVEVNAQSYGGVDESGKRTGLAAFKEVDEISMVCAPDETTHSGLRGKVKDHCVNMADRIAILQADPDTTPSSLAQSGPGVASSYAAYYYPWLQIRDPETNLEKKVPPGGHVAGIYARSDSQHGVHKAPANEQVRGIEGLEFTVTKAEQASLNPKGVNCIRSFTGRGTRVWGARTTASDPSWKYVNVRRLFLFLEESIDEGTQWVVFESNDQDTWARVRQTIKNFLTGVWEDGALMGSTPEEAFYVKCDRTTMTQDDIDNGRLICEIGVAPVKPAEFVVFRIAQWTGGE